MPEDDRGDRLSRSCRVAMRGDSGEVDCVCASSSSTLKLCLDRVETVV